MTSVSEEPVAVEFCDITTAVPLETVWMTAPAGVFACPMLLPRSAEVNEPVALLTLGEPLVVTPSDTDRVAVNDTSPRTPNRGHPKVSAKIGPAVSNVVFR